jgi:hypothetical protein
VIPDSKPDAEETTIVVALLLSAEVSVTSWEVEEYFLIGMA